MHIDITLTPRKVAMFYLASDQQKLQPFSTLTLTIPDLKEAVLLVLVDRTFECPRLLAVTFPHNFKAPLAEFLKNAGIALSGVHRKDAFEVRIFSPLPGALPKRLLIELNDVSIESEIEAAFSVKIDYSAERAGFELLKFTDKKMAPPASDAKKPLLGDVSDALTGVPVYADFTEFGKYQDFRDTYASNPKRVGYSTEKREDSDKDLARRVGWPRKAIQMDVDNVLALNLAPLDDDIGLGGGLAAAPAKGEPGLHLMIYDPETHLAVFSYIPTSGPRVVLAERLARYCAAQFLFQLETYILNCTFVSDSPPDRRGLIVTLDRAFEMSKEVTAIRNHCLECIEDVLTIDPVKSRPIDRQPRYLAKSWVYVTAASEHQAMLVAQPSLPPKLISFKSNPRMDDHAPIDLMSVGEHWANSPRYNPLREKTDVCEAALVCPSNRIFRVPMEDLPLFAPISGEEIFIWSYAPVQNIFSGLLASISDIEARLKPLEFLILILRNIPMDTTIHFCHSNDEQAEFIKQWLHALKDIGFLQSEVVDLAWMRKEKKTLIRFDPPEKKTEGQTCSMDYIYKGEFDHLLMERKWKSPPANAKDKAPRN